MPLDGAKMHSRKLLGHMYTLANESRKIIEYKPSREWMELHDGTFIGAYISLLYISIPLYNREGYAILSRPASNNFFLRFANGCAIKRTKRNRRVYCQKATLTMW